MAAQAVEPVVENVLYGLHRLPHLGSSLLQVLIPDEVRNLWKQNAWQMESGRSARTLVKYPDLRIVLVSMKANTRLKQHKIDARFAILTLAGHVRLHLPDASVEVPAGELLAVDRNVRHRQSSFLLIIACRSTAASWYRWVLYVRQPKFSPVGRRVVRRRGVPVPMFPVRDSRRMTGSEQPLSLERQSKRPWR